MAVVPDFLIKRVYKKGSLKQTDEGVEFQLKNVLGPGVISGLEFIKINGFTFGKDVIKFITQGAELLAQFVNEQNPIHFRLGQEGTMQLEKAECLHEGLNEIIIEFRNPEIGTMQITLTDEVRFAS